MMVITELVKQVSSFNLNSSSFNWALLCIQIQHLCRAEEIIDFSYRVCCFSGYILLSLGKEPGTEAKLKEGKSPGRKEKAVENLFLEKVARMVATNWRENIYQVRQIMNHTC